MEDKRWESVKELADANKKNKEKWKTIKKEVYEETRPGSGKFVERKEEKD